MAEETMNKKTGATPVVSSEDLSGGKVQGVTVVTTVLVKYTDGHGKSEVKLALVIPGGEVYFFANNALDTRPAQKWLKSAITRHLDRTQPKANGEERTPGLLEITEDTSQV
jgi:hypothetical protein